MRCIVYSGTGALLGVATLAHAQSSLPAVSQVATDPSTALLLQFLQAGGLPAALALVAWVIGRGGIPIHIQLSKDDRDALSGRHHHG